MNEIINYTRLTTSDKLPDKFITCQSYIPSDKDQASLGQIFTHLEIQSPWFPTNQVGQAIINTLIKEYYRGTNSSELINFEEAVKRVNESLAQIAQSGETEWIGKLSGVLVLINQDQIHLAQTGKSHAYLYRANRVNHITEGLENEEAPHPLKTFSNLTSGNLQEGDKIIIANNTFFEVIAPNELKLIISSMPPASAAIECARILQNHGSQEANAIFVEVTNIENLANLSPEEKIEAVYLDQQVLSLKGVGKNVISGFTSKLSSALKNSSEKFSSFSKEKFNNQTKKQKNEDVHGKDEDFESEAVEHADEFESSEHNNKIADKIKTPFLKIKNKLRRSLIHTGLYSRKRSKMYLVLLGAVILVLALTIGLSLNSRNKSAKARAAEGIYNEMVSVSGQADVIFSNNPNDAASRYEELINLQEKLKGTKLENKGKEIADKAISKVNQISKMEKIDPSKSIDIKTVASIALDDRNVYLVAENSLYQSQQDSFEPKRIASLGLTPSYLSFASDLKLLAGVSNYKLVSFEISGEAVKTSSLEFKTPQAMKSYSGLIYLLDTKANQIYKVSYEDQGFTKKADYLKESTDLNNISDIAIDGSLYTLSKKGSVTRYSRGSKISDFQINIPGSNSVEYLNLFADENSDQMIVAAKAKNEIRLIKIKKNGELIKQYSLNGFGNDLKSITINNDNSKAYISNQTKVQEFKLN